MEVVSPGQGINGHGPSSPKSATIDPDLIVRHLAELLEVTLGATTEDLEGKDSILSTARRRDTVQRCTRFASESQVALYVQKSFIARASVNGDLNTHASLGICLCKSGGRYSVLNSLQNLEPHTTSICSHRRYPFHLQQWRPSPCLSDPNRSTPTFLSQASYK